MRGILSIAALAAAACAGNAPAPAAPAAKQCFDPAHPGGVSIELARPGDQSVLATPADAGDGRVALASVETAGAAPLEVTENSGCGATPCDPELAAGAAHVALPHVEELEASPDTPPFVVDWVSAPDVDGDGRPEAWVAYRLTIGGTTTGYVAMFSLPDLALRFTAPTDCGATLAYVDADCDGRPDLVLEKSCAAPAVYHCGEDGAFTAR